MKKLLNGINLKEKEIKNKIIICNTKKIIKRNLKEKEIKNKIIIRNKKK